MEKNQQPKSSEPQQSPYSKFSKHLNTIQQTIISPKQILAKHNEIKKLRDESESLFLLDTAVFFTDKLITIESEQQKSSAQQSNTTEINNNNLNDEIYHMAKLLQQKQQYHRSALMIVKNDLHRKNLSALYLAAKCYYDCKEYSKALELLNLPIDNLQFNTNGGTFNQWKSSIQSLKGYIHESLNDKELANKCFFEALQLDPFCYEAFEALIKFDMINNEQECQLLEFLQQKTTNISNDTSEIDAINMIKELYSLKFCHTTANSYNKSKNNQSNENVDSDVITCNGNESIKLSNESLSLQNSNDLQLIQAEIYYNDCHFYKCFDIVQKIHSKDILNEKCIFLMIGCLLELKNEIKLQELSHKLAESLPETAITWYSIGCYYYLTSNMDLARKYLSKSTLIDQNYQSSMLMYGHTFESEALHDQAIAVYMDLSKIMAHSYLPLLYVGVEYCHLNFPTMSLQYLNQALLLSPDNLFILHELGIVYYEKKEYEVAKNYFQNVHKILMKKQILMKYPYKWEPLINNLGHCYRKLSLYDDSIKYFKISIQMIPDNYQTLDSLGLVYSLKGDRQMAIDYFSKALSIKRDDSFALTMYHLLSSN